MLTPPTPVKSKVILAVKLEAVVPNSQYLSGLITSIPPGKSPPGFPSINLAIPLLAAVKFCVPFIKDLLAFVKLKET